MNRGYAPVSDSDVYGVVAGGRSRRTPRWFCDQCQESASKFAGVGVQGWERSGQKWFIVEVAPTQRRWTRTSRGVTAIFRAVSWRAGPRWLGRVRQTLRIKGETRDRAKNEQDNIINGATTTQWRRLTTKDDRILKKNFSLYIFVPSLIFLSLSLSLSRFSTVVFTPTSENQSARLTSRVSSTHSNSWTVHKVSGIEDFYQRIITADRFYLSYQFGYSNARFK